MLRWKQEFLFGLLLALQVTQSTVSFPPSLSQSLSLSPHFFLSLIAVSSGNTHFTEIPNPNREKNINFCSH